MKRALLLRAVNVSGHGILPMAELATLCTAAGCRNARTYLASGNVVFEAPAALARALPGKLAAAIDKRFGFAPTVMLREHAELAAIAKANPFPRAAPKALHVAFLDDEPGRAAIASLDPARSPGDEFVVRGREIYVCYAQGAGKTKLSNAYFEAKLGVRGTMRNWNTLTALVKLTA